MNIVPYVPEICPSCDPEPSQTQQDIRKILADRAFKFASPPPKPQPVLRLGGKIISTPGNITNIQAGPKAGKTSVEGAIMAAAFGGTARDADTLGFTAENTDGRALLHFDTEQSRFDHDSLIRVALRRAGIETDPPWFHSYCLTDLSILERLAAIQQAIEDANELHEGIFAILIDGVADICNDPNDAAEAFNLVGYLHSTAIKYDCSVITVLHENPGSETGKMRGHLGSQLERKAETPLRLAKNAASGITTVWCDRARHCHIPKELGTCFVWSDVVGMHVSCGTEAALKADAEHLKFTREAVAAFQSDESLSFGALVGRIMFVTSLRNRAAKDRVKTYCAKEIVSKEGNEYHLTPRPSA
jgi:hypothetical protein